MVSFNPETFTSSLSDGDVTITAAEFEERESEWGNQIVLEIEMTDADGKVHPRHYNVGKSDYVQVIDDGKGVDAVDSDNEYSISGRSGAGKFFQALVSSGFPVALLDKGDVSLLVGTKVRVETQSSGTKKLDGSDNTILLPTKVLDGVGGKEKKRATKKTRSTKPEAENHLEPETDEGDEESAEESAEGSVEDFAAELINGILMDADDQAMTVKQMGTEIFNRMKKDSRKGEVLRLSIDPEFLQENWTYTAKTKMVSI